MRQYFVAANWKMHGDTASNTALLNELMAGLESTLAFQLVIAAPSIYLQQVLRLTEQSDLKVSAQNVSEFERGAYTGEISANMLADMGCAYSLVGHSERRQLFHETNDAVAKKFCVLQEKGLTPILCVGETLEQRESGNTEQVVAEQLSAVVSLAGIDGLKNVVIAYEPVWAIGTGKTASPEQAQAVHQFLRSEIAKSSAHVAESVQIVYGGSVNEENAQSLFTQKDIDGGLIGGASLKAESFLNICKVVNCG